MTFHPYQDAAPYQRWRRAISRTPADDVDPVVHAKFRIGPSDRVVTVGSSFAEHAGHALGANGYRFLVTETAHPLLPQALVEQFGYGLYTARTGTIYTARQLLQLMQRAYGRLQPAEDVWETAGRLYDPFRPGIQPDGFATRLEYDRDRERHFAAVRAAFETMDVLVFTLGQTECWAHADGCVFPVCPGTVAGTFSPSVHAPLSFSVAETVADFTGFLAAVRTVNPGVRVVLTVSPVPLAATAVDRHVLVSNTYSKSVLRVAAEMLAEDPDVQYFPSYEVITGSFSESRYFSPDRRLVTLSGIDRTTRLFMRHLTEGKAAGTPTAPAEDDHFDRSQRAVAGLCEEEAFWIRLEVKIRRGDDVSRQPATLS